jgi:hypothetical protein
MSKKYTLMVVRLRELDRKHDGKDSDHDDHDDETYPSLLPQAPRYRRLSVVGVVLWLVPYQFPLQLSPASRCGWNEYSYGEMSENLPFHSIMLDVDGGVLDSYNSFILLLNQQGHLVVRSAQLTQNKTED